MPYYKNSKCKQTCAHSRYKVGKGWYCELYDECFMCSLCANHQWKEEDVKHEH